MNERIKVVGMKSSVVLNSLIVWVILQSSQRLSSRFILYVDIQLQLCET